LDALWSEDTREVGRAAAGGGDDRARERVAQFAGQLVAAFELAVMSV
jgi:hypothetical protein